MGHDLKTTAEGRCPSALCSIKDFITIIKNGSRYSDNIYSHSIDTGDLAYIIALEFMKKSEAEVVRNSGYLHDIGKIAIPLTILEKPSKFTIEEKKIMDYHVEIGTYILKKYGLDRESQIISQHHERMDGSGYPKGIMGADILMESKIIGLCDVYTALTVKRPYRGKMSSERAFEIICQQREQFDSEVLSAFEYILHSERLCASINMMI